MSYDLKDVIADKYHFDLKFLLINHNNFYVNFPIHILNVTFNEYICL